MEVMTQKPCPRERVEREMPKKLRPKGGSVAVPRREMADICRTAKPQPGVSAEIFWGVQQGPRRLASLKIATQQVSGDLLGGR